MNVQASNQTAVTGYAQRARGLLVLATIIAENCVFSTVLAGKREPIQARSPVLRRVGGFPAIMMLLAAALATLPLLAALPIVAAVSSQL